MKKIMGVRRMLAVWAAKIVKKQVYTSFTARV